MHRARSFTHARARRRLGAALSTLALAAFIVGLTAIPAFAAVSCSGGATMTIDVTAGTAFTISLSGAPAPFDIDVTPNDGSCGTFDTGTVTSIHVNGLDGQNDSLTIDQSGAAAFPVGSTATFVLAMGTGTDSLAITGAAGADVIGLGANGISLDSGQTPDVTGTGTVETFTVNSGAGDDQVSGAGGGGLGGVFTAALVLNGSDGADNLAGGSGADTINGGNGNDTLAGNDGNDTVNGGTDSGADSMTGGNGTDTLSYSGVSGAVTVNLATTTAQTTGGAGSDTINTFENLVGGIGEPTR